MKYVNIHFMREATKDDEAKIRTMVSENNIPYVKNVKLEANAVRLYMENRDGICVSNIFVQVEQCLKHIYGYDEDITINGIEIY